MTEKISMTVEEIYNVIIKLLDDKKAENIVTINLKDKSAMADRLVIASGNSGRQVGSMAENIYRELKAHGIKANIEGMPECNWVLVDAGDIVVHLFRPEVRVFYNLEKMWGMEMPQSTPAG